MTRIVAISDTHAKSLSQLPQDLVALLPEADYVVHCGDFTSLSLLEELRGIAKRFIAVHGNVDPREVRDQLPPKTVFEVNGTRIGVIHPHWGGPPWGIEDDIAAEFDGVDIILYGHTHDTCHKTIRDIVFVNPGQAYPMFRTSASAALLTIDARGTHIEIRVFG